MMTFDFEAFIYKGLYKTLCLKVHLYDLLKQSENVLLEVVS